MEKCSKGNDSKTRRLTYRQRVLSVYPQAFISYAGWSFEKPYCVYAPMMNPVFKQEVYEVLAEDIKTRDEAWKEAWKSVQKDLIKRLES